MPNRKECCEHQVGIFVGYTSSTEKAENLVTLSPQLDRTDSAGTVELIRRQCGLLFLRARFGVKCPKVVSDARDSAFIHWGIFNNIILALTRYHANYYASLGGYNCPIFPSSSLTGAHPEWTFGAYFDFMICLTHFQGSDFNGTANASSYKDIEMPQQWLLSCCVKYHLYIMEWIDGWANLWFIYVKQSQIPSIPQIKFFSKFKFAWHRPILFLAVFHADRCRFN